MDRLALNIELYKGLLLIRRSEEAIIRRYDENEMRTPMHMSMGSEAISVGVCGALQDDDQVFGTYRSHALYLAKTRNLYNFFAEMYGRDSALLKGRGGSMHLCDPTRGFLGTSAIVASPIPVAAGAAFANKIRNRGRVVAVFFGDGATDEGVFWESLNLACLMQLPLLFVCEDNQLAVHTHARERRGFKDICAVVSQFNCSVMADDTTEVEAIYEAARRAVDGVRTSSIPCFMRLGYYRYLEHVGIHEDFDAGYRSRDEYERWLERDPLTIQRARLLSLGMPEEAIREVEKETCRRVVEVIERVRDDPFSKAEELHKEVFECDE